MAWIWYIHILINLVTSNTIKYAKDLYKHVKPDDCLRVLQSVQKHCPMIVLWNWLRFRNHGLVLFDTYDIHVYVNLNQEVHSYWNTHVRADCGGNKQRIQIEHKSSVLNSRFMKECDRKRNRRYLERVNNKTDKEKHRSRMFVFYYDSLQASSVSTEKEIYFGCGSSW